MGPSATPSALLQRIAASGAALAGIAATPSSTQSRTAGDALLETALHGTAHCFPARLGIKSTISCRVKNNNNPFLGVQATRKSPPPLFGVDLETVVTRENSGMGVPFLVQKCVEEVERRGMDIVGLYRLCGSATKKRILREAFERNPRLVDLSPDSVPDINVITGPSALC